MITKVFMEALSPTMEEGRLVTWHKREGDAVAVGDILAEVETDKAVMELQARGDGVLRSVLVGEGKTVDVGSLVAVIAAPDDDIGDVAGAPAAAAPAAPAASPPATAAAPEPAPASAAPPVGEPAAGERTKASPLARRLARERGLSLAAVRGSGPGGRIVKRDVEAHQETAPAVAATAGDGYEDVPLSQVRKTIATRLVESIGPIPHFFLTAEVDMERAAEARTELNALGDTKVSFNDIAVKAVATALRQHRACNAWWQGDHVRYFDAVHIGMAVAIEDGLITPVIRHADAKSLRTIATESRELAARAGAAAHARGIHRQYVLGLEPRDVRYRPVHRRHQSAGGRHPGHRLDHAEARRGRRRGRGAAAHACHDELRPSRHRRRHRSTVPRHGAPAPGEPVGVRVVRPDGRRTTPIR
jgi:pyruvate dehydrogenase E2 component (dihydrolipoamide acetyltransferase)